MTVPGRPAVFLAALLSLLLIAAVVEPRLIAVAAAGDMVILLLCRLDGRRLRKLPVIVTRHEWSRYQINRTASFTYRIENRSPFPVIVSLRQPWPASFSSESNRAWVRVEASKIITLGLEATPQQRGQIRIPATEVDLALPFGWSKRRWDVTEPQNVTVYPDLQRLYEYDALRRSHSLRQFGLHRQRMVGAGREFEQLREYLPDDDFRDVNWKATARRRKPITNVYQTERSQDVFLCIDCGRMMGNPVATGTALDRAIDASIMLAHVSYKEGDRTGLALFKDTVSLFLKPKNGQTALRRIIEELVDVVPEPVFPSYAALATTLKARHKRRSMIFLFTDLNDPQLASDLATVLPVLSRRHIFVVVSLKDPLLDTVAAGPAQNHKEICRVLAARSLSDERAARARDLVRSGVQVLEADPSAITMEVINRYLEIKMRQLL